jgi:hypothetical protein
MLSEMSQKSPPIFVCEKCNYSTSKKSDYSKHLLTRKHENVDKLFTANDKNPAKKYECICGKQFSHRQSLFIHRKKCPEKCPKKQENFEQPITTDLVMKLIQQNQNLQDKLYDVLQDQQNMLQDQQNKIYELAKDSKSITNNTTNNTTNNNTQFNLNVFLNEKCKDALNLTDFVDSLNVKLKDLEYTAKTSYAEGISQIFINGLTTLNVHERPIHCSDSKREVLYIKEQNLWKKEDVDKTKLTKAIKTIGNKNMKQISEWQKAYPEYNDPTSKQNDKYMKMICNAMSGSTKEESEKNYEKIIRNIAKEVLIDKNE